MYTFVFMEVDIGKTCDSCQARGLQATKAVVFCTTCKELYCDLCTDYHKGFKLTRDHVLVDANARLNSDSKKRELVPGIIHDDESGSDFEGFVKLENTSTQPEPKQDVGEMSLKMAQVHVSTENEKPETYIETEVMNQETSSEIYIEGDNSEQEIFHSQPEHLHPCHRGFHPYRKHPRSWHDFGHPPPWHNPCNHREDHPHPHQWWEEHGRPPPPHRPGHPPPPHIPGHQPPPNRPGHPPPWSHPRHPRYHHENHRHPFDSDHSTLRPPFGDRPPPRHGRGRPRHHFGPWQPPME